MKIQHFQTVENLITIIVYFKRDGDKIKGNIQNDVRRYFLNLKSPSFYKELNYFGINNDELEVDLFSLIKYDSREKNSRASTGALIVLSYHGIKYDQTIKKISELLSSRSGKFPGWENYEVLKLKRM